MPKTGNRESGMIGLGLRRHKTARKRLYRQTVCPLGVQKAKDRKHGRYKQ